MKGCYSIATLTSVLPSELGDPRAVAAGHELSSKGSSTVVRAAIPYHAILTFVLLLVAVLSSKMAGLRVAAADWESSSECWQPQHRSKGGYTVISLQ